MRNNNVFIAFPSKSTAVSVAKMVAGDGMNVACITTTGGELKKYIGYYGGGIVVCGYKFSDMHIPDLLDDIPPEFTIILIGSPEQLSHCNSDRLFKLSVPLQRTELLCSINMLVNMDTQFKTNINERDVNADKIINRAKRTLIEQYDMTEDQAHRYMQKKSMDTGKKMVDIARIIIS